MERKADERKVQLVEIDKILIPEERVTSIVDDETLRELEESIKERGILQPLYIMNVDGKLILVDGLHRLLVAKKLGIKKVPCIIKPGTEKDLLIENLIVNRQRGRSDPIGEATVLYTLINEHKMSIAQAARALKISESTARKYLQILKLPDEVKQLIRMQKLGLECAYWISKLQDREQQISVAHDAVAYGYTAQMCRARVLQLLRPDFSPEETGYTFTPEGAPQKVLPRCEFCSKELSEDARYIWVCRECYELLKAAYEELLRYESEQREAQQIATPPQPVQQQYIAQQGGSYTQTQYTQPTGGSYTQQTQQSEWVWLDDCTLVNIRTKEIRKVC